MLHLEVHGGLIQQVSYTSAYRTDREQAIFAAFESACANAGRRCIPVKTDDALIYSHADLRLGDTPTLEYIFYAAMHTWKCALFLATQALRV